MLASSAQQSGSVTHLCSFRFFPTNRLLQGIERSSPWPTVGPCGMRLTLEPGDWVKQTALPRAGGPGPTSWRPAPTGQGHTAMNPGTGAKEDVIQDAREEPLCSHRRRCGLDPWLGKTSHATPQPSLWITALSPSTQSRCHTSREAMGISNACTAMRNPRTHSLQPRVAPAHGHDHRKTPNSSKDPAQPKTTKYYKRNIK